MTDKTKKSSSERGLGRGLSALMSDVNLDDVTQDTPKQPAPQQSQSDSAPSDGKGVHVVTMGQLVRNPDQPRRHFDKKLLSELAESIRDKGVLQPILVRPLPKSAKAPKTKNNKPVYQIIAGERRWTAATQAGLDTMPVFIREITDREALEIGVVENVQRADLNPMEEALAYKALIDQFERTQEDVAEAVGKSRPYISNMLRLLNLPDRVQTYLAEGKISTGHARAIIAAPDPNMLADNIVDKGMSVREAENWVRKIKNASAANAGQGTQKSADDRRLEAELMDVLGLIVDLKHKGPGGELRIKYKSGDQLADIVSRLKG